MIIEAHVFNSIQGVITEKTDDTLFISTGGVEWDIIAPSSDIAALPNVGETSKVWTWLYHKEDGMRIFGFCNETRRKTFIELLKVDGIGPKAAAKIMSHISQEDMENAVNSEDLHRLEKVPGLGRKTAQKLLLALKGKLSHTSYQPETVSQYADIIQALTTMGYDKRAVTAAVAKAAEIIPPDSDVTERERELFKHAILQLSTS
jgi:Holliday junction DNA helicase RuvA